ncbi:MULTISPECIES: hypothetical protein [Flavobacterium]|uniref:Uncharacterized protein n=1 Tax=Flavobacterium sedimenticola TaxID=3043286 RepID=A0ABT6XPB2_9FLAO|nr:hypothetical protein [Flavobacterium sedimenticola]MDI9256930.1 hypothetical protein [Flavobacterium sedimenticola]
MKNTRILRFLSLFGFLLLMAPFYDSCDGKGLFPRSRQAVNIDGTPIESSFPEKIYDVVVDEDSFNAVEIAYMAIMGFQELTFKEFKNELSSSFQKDDWYNNLSFFVSIIFDFIVIISLLLVVFSFTAKSHLFAKLALTNTVLVLLTFLYVIFLESSFEHWRQIKWGYYAFILVNGLLFYYSKVQRSSSKP